MKRSSRREFLAESLLAAGAISLPAAAQDGPKASPSERLSVGVIGVHGQGSVHVKKWAALKDVEVAAICDPDEKVIAAPMKTIEDKGGRKPEYYRDIRKLLENKSLDAVSIATPNHWHVLASLWAVQAGKDVYVEKPLSHNIWEGRKLVEASRKYDRMVQMGNYPRSSPHLRSGIEFVRSGKMGKARLGRCIWYSKRPSIGKKQDAPVPPGVDYDLWLGPAPERPFNPNRFHYNWHWNWDYGGGEIANNGIYLLDTARWGLGKAGHPARVLSLGGRFGEEDDGQTPNTQLALYDYGDVRILMEIRGLPTDKFRNITTGTLIECEKGVLVASTKETAAYTPEGELIERFTGEGDHFRNFVDAVKSRKREALNSEVLDGHLSTSLCHLANISYRLGEKRETVRADAFGSSDEANDAYRRYLDHLKDNDIELPKTPTCFGKALNFDPGTETFTGDAAANALVGRVYRKPYVVPDQV
jgi:predicted dehydrogenase